MTMSLFPRGARPAMLDFNTSLSVDKEAIVYTDRFYNRVPTLGYATLGPPRNSEIVDAIP